MILVIGAGDVGSNLVSDLEDSHEVTVVDRDPDRIDSLTARYDVTGVVGDGRSIATLREADIDRAEIVVASTDSDAANVMVCNAAKHSGDPYTIARVKEVGLFETWRSLEGGLGVDTMLCIDRLAAEAVARTIALPGALSVDTFAGGKVEVAEFEIGADTPITGRSVAEADRYASTTFVAVLRDDEVIIPTGETVIRQGDRVVAIGSLTSISQFAEAVSDQPALESDANVVIVGGDELGYQIAQQFESRGWSPTIIERDPDQANRLATRLRSSSVTETDATNVGGFNPDVLSGADLAVGAVDDDTNYLLAQLATEFDVDRTAAVVDDPDVVELFEETGLDVIVHPEDSIVSETLRVIYGTGPEEVSVLEHDSAEVLEVVVDEESALTGKALQDATDQLPADIVIGAIVRNDQLQIPRGNRIIQAGDRVIVFVDASVAGEVAAKI
ncbi:Trk system potassium transporter TrkA [Halopiger djelfimassiliensis]|uniref:Trk system potassium transporter TrkA n=1 Tax=Halopiger djelfimassiliensis TaxID=1293047 RepID=UPI0006782D53|nr:Trk system potassium transporter TrkA [Halopiger djelfimassiliensis]